MGVVDKEDLRHLEKKTLQNRETAWPGRLTKTIFSPHFNSHQCQTLRLNPLKNLMKVWYDNAGFGRLVGVVDMEDL